MFLKNKISFLDNNKIVFYHLMMILESALNMNLIITSSKSTSTINRQIVTLQTIRKALARVAKR